MLPRVRRLRGDSLMPPQLGDTAAGVGVDDARVGPAGPWRRDRRATRKHPEMTQGVLTAGTVGEPSTELLDVHRAHAGTRRATRDTCHGISLAKPTDSLTGVTPWRRWVVWGILPTTAWSVV
jgi:hypothetical protein